MKNIGSIITGFYSFCILLLQKLLAFFLIFLAPMCAATTFSEGEEYFLSNETDLAIQKFEMSLIDGSATPNVYTLLGISYLQNGDYQKALETFLNGTAESTTNKRGLYYNAGNASYLLQDYEKAYEYYNLTIVADPSYVNAYLNRANTNVQLLDFRNAIKDYTMYLTMFPENEQAETIYQMITTLENELELVRLEEERKELEEIRLAQEKERLIEEQKLIEEQNKIAAQQAEEEAKRRQDILNQLSSTLNNAQTKNISAGTEGAVEYEYEEAELE